MDLDGTQQQPAGLDDRALRLAAAVILVAVVGVLLTGDEPVRPVVWGLVAVVTGLVGTRGWDALDVLTRRAGGLLLTVAVAVLVAATGGAGSPFQDLYAAPLFFDAAVRRSRLWLTAFAVAVAVLSPVAYGEGSGTYVRDALFDLTVWVVLAVLVRVVTVRSRAHAQDVQLLRAAVDEVTEAVTVLDLRDSTYHYVNHAAAAMAGLTREEMEATPPGDRYEWLAPEVRRRLERGETVATEVPLEDGGLVEVVFTPLSEQGLVATVGRDVTERRRDQAVRDRLAAIVASTSVAVVAMDLDGTITTFNRAAEDLFGWSADEAIGRRIDILLPDEDRSWAWAQVDVLRGGGDVHVETSRRRRDGTTVEVGLDLSAVHDDAGELVGVAALYRDLRERRAMERAVARGEQRLRTFGELADGIVYRLRVHPDVAVEYVGPGIESITGFTADEYRNDPDLPMRRSHPDDRRAVQQPRRIRPGGPTRVVYRFQHASGRWIWLEDHFRHERDVDGTVTHVEGVVFDVSARQELELSRQRALDRERLATARHLETIRMQQTFLQAVSHELRTPLTSIIGFAGTLAEYRGELTTDQAGLLVERLRHNAARLERLLLDLLDIDRAGGTSQDVRRVPTDLAALCDGLVQELDAPRHRVVLDLDGTPLVAVDRVRVERAVDNLLRNAVRHTPPGTTIHVRTHVTDEHVVLCVDDDGPGLPGSLVDTVFEPFSQGPQAASSASPGTGVGLTLVQQFAAAHGGEAWYEPVPGGGASFRIRLPRGVDDEVVRASSDV